MSNTPVLVIHRSRTNVVPISLYIDVSADTITSEIRTESGILIVTWDVTFDTDGSDGELILTLDDADVSDIPYPGGWMDIKRVSGGEPLAVFDHSLEVEFREVVTV